MGGLISTLRTAFTLLRGAFLMLKGIIKDYDALTKRMSTTPGIPQLSTDPHCLPPYWTIPAASVAHHGEDAELPRDSVDVVIIGSGITGTSIARALLDRTSYSDVERRKRGAPLKIVMLEARDACSGSTARNGGHITPNIYNEYSELKQQFSVSAAQDILRFRLAHITTLIAVAKEENLLSESQARLVEAFDAYMHPDMFRQATEELDVFLKEVPEDIGRGFAAVEARDELERLQLVSSIVGCISKPGAAVHPYRLVTGILSNLLAAHSNFQLFTRTPCTAIKSTSSSYVVSTPRGDVIATHVIHATNAWSSHLLPGMRGKIIPARTTMTAQRPGKGLVSSANPWTPGSRSFVFYPINDDTVFEYLTQQLTSPLIDGSDASGGCKPPVLPSSGEIMFGGRTQSSFVDNIGILDDNVTAFEDQAHLSGALERYFPKYWGEEGDNLSCSGMNPPNANWGKGRLKAAWSGLLGLSADLLPWVGRVPPSVSGRDQPADSYLLRNETSANPSKTLAPSGEWICAGYTGEGMTHAWLSGKALACMVVGNNNGNPLEDNMPNIPGPFLITEKRVRKARIENLVDRIA